jgi:hypothetical protein
VEELGRTRPKTTSELIEIASRFAMEKTLTTIKGCIHQKSTEQVGKGAGLATRMAA